MNLKEIDALLKCKPYVKQELATTDNSATLVNALPDPIRKEMDRLNDLCQEYRENGDRLMRVADEYKAEIERLNQHAVDVYKLNRESYLKMQHEIDALKAQQEEWRKFTDMANTTCDRKDAALRVALEVLSDEKYVSRYSQVTDAIMSINEVLK